MEMLNRQVRVELVKKNKSQDTIVTDQPEIGFEEKAAIAATILERSIKKIGLVVCAYVVLDTIRRIAVASASE